jgi:AcrR family transcriptional regulator
VKDVGLRQAKKAATRQQIADVAMRLFVTRGFDRVTVAEIAAEAGVSEKTVFNYFPSKEDLFFDEVPDRLQELAAGIRNRPAGESVLDALRRMQLGMVTRLTSPGFVHFASTLEGSPELLAKEVDVMARFSQVLADALQAEGLDERDARVVASLLMSVHRQYFRAARRLAIEGRSGPGAARRLRADIARSYELLENGLGGLLG